MTQFTCKGVRSITGYHLHSYLSAFFISAGVPNGEFSIKRAMNSSRIELLWLVWDQSRSKYYLRTKFQDGIDKPQILKSHFAVGALGDSIRFGIFVVYQFHPGT
jgi:hypothetical protein